MLRHHLDLMSDRRQEMSIPEQNRSRRRCWDVPASSHIHREELAQLASIRRRLPPLQRTCEDILANQSRNPGLANLSPTERIQITLPTILVKEACDTLIDYISSIEGTKRETNRDPRPAANKIIEFLEARSQPGTENTNHIRDLAEDIKRLFTPRAQREVAQASYHPDTALRQTDSTESVRTSNIRKLVDALINTQGHFMSLPQAYPRLYEEFNKQNGKPLNNIELDQAYEFVETYELELLQKNNLRARLKDSYSTAAAK